MPNPIVNYLQTNFRGATVTVVLVSGLTITGEVVDGFDNVLGLKAGGVITYINGNYITIFR